MAIVVTAPIASSTSYAPVERVSVTSDGVEAERGSGACLDSGWQTCELGYGVDLSANGELVVFSSPADDLVEGDANEHCWETPPPCRPDHEGNSGVASEGTDVFVRDRAAMTTMRASLTSTGEEADGFSSRARMSRDGRFIAFESVASNLMPGIDPSFPFRHIMLRDQVTGVTEHVTGSTYYIDFFHNMEPVVSDDGNIVAFIAFWFSEDGDDYYYVYFIDRSTGIPRRVNAIYGTTPNGWANTEDGLDISANGQFIVYSTGSTNIVSGDTNGVTDVFRYNRLNGRQVAASVGPNGWPGGGRGGRVSADGGAVAFWSDAQLTPDDTNAHADVYVRDFTAGTTTLVSTASDGTVGNGPSRKPSISDDGRRVAFESTATNLVAVDTNAVQDVFVHDLDTGVTGRASTTDVDVQANGMSREATISGDGSTVAFSSLATNLVPDDTNGTWDVFVRDVIGIEVEVPGAPAGVTGVPGDEEVEVSWAAPVDDGGVAILDYTVTVSPGGAEVVVDGDETSAVVGGLTNGTAYTFTVVATNAAGDGPASVPSVAVTPRTVPGAPTGVEVFAADGEATVTWVPPVSDGGAAITSFEVVVGGGGAGAPSGTGAEVVGVPAGATGVVVDGLPNDVVSSFSVRAVNVAGAGPASSPVVEATPHECADPLLFTDVPGAHPFCGDIEWLIWGGVTTGFPDGTFKPAAGLSRQALAAFLYRHAGSPDGLDPICTAAPFPDVGFSHGFCGEIAWAADEGLLGAYANGGFKPGASVTRQSLAAVFYRAAGSPDGPDPACSSAPFTDVPVGHAFCGEISWAADAGVTGGYADGGFHPAALVSRQAFAAQLRRSDDLAHGILL